MKLEDTDVAAKFWHEGDGWRGWEINEEMNYYFFNDIPAEKLSDSFFDLDEMQGIVHLD